MDEQVWRAVTIETKTDAEKVKIAEYIHKQLVGNVDYIENRIVLNMDEPCKIQLNFFGVRKADVPHLRFW